MPVLFFDVVLQKGEGNVYGTDHLFISDAAKRGTGGERTYSRYWEEELELPIKRNELGHRYDTEEDVETFSGQIKGVEGERDCS